MTFVHSRFVKIILATILLGLLDGGTGGASAQDPAVREHEVKAALVYNFAKFISWPDSAFGGPADPFLICILTSDPSSSVMESSLKGKAVNGRTIKVSRSDDLQSFGRCQVFFVSATKKEMTAEVLNKVRSENVLTIGETEGFANSGGIIGLFSEGDKIRFEINTDAAAKTNLRISSKLLSLGAKARR
jgi:hypothetical protein